MREKAAGKYQKLECEGRDTSGNNLKIKHKTDIHQVFYKFQPFCYTHTNPIIPMANFSREEQYTLASCGASEPLLAYLSWPRLHPVAHADLRGEPCDLSQSHVSTLPELRPKDGVP